jgi:hypothetical protein
MGLQPTETDKGHFAPQDVPKLPEFIETRFAQDAANGGNARILGDFVKRP